MLLFLWMYALTTAMIPGGEHIVRHQASAIEAYMRAQIEAVAPRPGVAIGAAAPFARGL